MCLALPQAGHSTAAFDCCCPVSFLYQQMWRPEWSKDRDRVHGFLQKGRKNKCVLIVENPLPNMLNLLNSLRQAMRQRNTLLRLAIPYRPPRPLAQHTERQDLNITFFLQNGWTFYSPVFRRGTLVSIHINYTPWAPVLGFQPLPVPQLKDTHAHF